MPEWVESIDETRERIRLVRGRDLRIGLVPTMGALHEGHLRLIQACRSVVDYVVVSLFVNPTQFGPSEDLSRYPRTPEADLELCARGGAELIFAPRSESIYPRGPVSTWVEVPGLSSILEGASRPGHFRGVATVVLKLLNIVSPDVACFGKKDFQQLAVIRRMVEDLNLAVEIQAVETVRESDGLAMSSRNRYLDPVQRQAAVVLFQALNAACQSVTKGETDAERVRQIMRQTVQSQESARLDYAEVADAASLEPLERLPHDRPAVALLAAWLGPARLIDNQLLPSPQAWHGTPGQD